MRKETECKWLADRIGVDREVFDPWDDANDDLDILDYFKKGDPDIYSDYKDALYHETKGHGTHNVWEYKKGKFANAALAMTLKLGWRNSSAPYGLCPLCGAKGISRERRPDGDDRCTEGHCYPSSKAVTI